MTDTERPTLPDAVDYILGGPHLTVLATADSDGTPQTSIVFVLRDGDDLLFSTLRSRQKAVNMYRDPRVNLLVHGLPVERPNQAGDGPNYATITGTVELTDDPGGTFHRRMYAVHMNGATPPPEPGAQRVTARLLVERVYLPSFPG